MVQAFLSSPYFGVVLSVGAYLLGVWLFKLSKGFFLFAPLFFAMILGVLILHFFKISLADYKKGGDIIFFFLTPATIAFAIPLYKMVLILKKYWFQIFLSIFVGLFLSLSAIYSLGYLFKVSDVLIKSLLPQSATTAVALPISIQIGGIEAITGYVVIFSAVIVYASGGVLLNMAKVTNPVAKGIALGTTGKALGAAVARDMGSVEASMSSISLIIISLITAFGVPLFLKIVGMSF